MLANDWVALQAHGEWPAGFVEAHPQGDAWWACGRPGLVFGPEGEGHLRFSFSVAEPMIQGGIEALRSFASASRP